MRRPAQIPEAHVFSWAPAVLVLGYVLMAFALLSASHGAGAEFTGRPSCDGQPMSSGDTCRVSHTQGSSISFNSYTYQEMLARQQVQAQENPWIRGALAGTVGTILILGAAGRRLTVRKLPTRRAVRTSLLLTAAGPLLVMSGVVGLIELQYDRELREESFFLTLPGPDLPGAPLLMMALIAVTAAITLAAIRSSYRHDPEFAHVYPPPAGSQPPRSSTSGSAGTDLFETSGLAPALHREPPGNQWPRGTTDVADPTLSPPGTAIRATSLPGQLPGPPGQPPRYVPAAPKPAPPWSAPVATPPASAPAEPPFSSLDKWIISIRLSQVAIAISAAVWLGVISQWHWGYVLFALVGTVGVGLMGVDRSTVPRGAEVAHQLLWLFAGVAAAVGAGWIGASSSWHAGIIATFWFAVMVAVYVSGNAVEAQGGSEADRADHRIRLPVAALVPVVLVAVGAIATVLVGNAAGWHWLVVLAIWVAVVTASIGYAGASIPLIQRGAGGQLAGRVRRTGAVPICVLLAGVAGSYWLGGFTGWQIGAQLLWWGGLAVAAAGPEAVLAWRTRPAVPETSD